MDRYSYRQTANGRWTVFVVKPDGQELPRADFATQSEAAKHIDLLAGAFVALTVGVPPTPAQAMAELVRTVRHLDEVLPEVARLGARVHALVDVVLLADESGAADAVEVTSTV